MQGIEWIGSVYLVAAEKLLGWYKNKRDNRSVNLLRQLDIKVEGAWNSMVSGFIQRQIAEIQF